MRITGGKARGIVLKTPQGQRTRPAADAMRESLFSSLGEWVEGSRVLDLYAGTGSYGLEALSRGAQAAQFVEADARCIACLRDNLTRVAKSCDLSAGVGVVSKVDVFNWGDSGEGNWDLIIADPPYADLPRVETKLFDLARRSLQASGYLILEQPADLTISADGWTQVKRLGKKRGNGPALSIWKKD